MFRKTRHRALRSKSSVRIISSYLAHHPPLLPTMMHKHVSDDRRNSSGLLKGENQQHAPLNNASWNPGPNGFYRYAHTRVVVSQCCMAPVPKECTGGGLHQSLRILPYSGLNNLPADCSCSHQSPPPHDRRIDASRSRPTLHLRVDFVRRSQQRTARVATDVPKKKKKLNNSFASPFVSFTTAYHDSEARCDDECHRNTKEERGNIFILLVRDANTEEDPASPTEHQS